MMMVFHLTWMSFLLVYCDRKPKTDECLLTDEDEELWTIKERITKKVNHLFRLQQRDDRSLIVPHRKSPSTTGEFTSLLVGRM